MKAADGTVVVKRGHTIFVQHRTEIRESVSETIRDREKEEEFSRLPPNLRLDRGASDALDRAQELIAYVPQDDPRQFVPLAPALEPLKNEVLSVLDVRREITMLGIKKALSETRYVSHIRSCLLHLLSVGLVTTRTGKFWKKVRT